MSGRIGVPALRPASPADAAALSELALRSKAHWGYSEAFMARCTRELCYRPQDICRLHVVAATLDGALAGFYALAPPRGEEVELEALFVAPEAMRQGLGRRLLDHAARRARRLGARRLTVQSDPNAEGFYLAAGARVTGKRASGSIPGRQLPTLALDLD